MSDQAIVLPAKLDTAAAFHLTRNEQGYVHTPWFSYEEPNDFNLSQQKYHYVRRAAVEAFALVLKISSYDVTITEKKVDSGMQDHRVFRLETRFPTALPSAVPIVKKAIEPGATNI